MISQKGTLKPVPQMYIIYIITVKKSNNNNLKKKQKKQQQTKHNNKPQKNTCSFHKYNGKRKFNINGVSFLKNVKIKWKQICVVNGYEKKFVKLFTVEGINDLI